MKKPTDFDKDEDEDQLCQLLVTESTQDYAQVLTELGPKRISYKQLQEDTSSSTRASC